MSTNTLAGYGLARWVEQRWGDRILPASAVLVLLIQPAKHLSTGVQSAPPGLVALAGSFLLLGLGTGFALTRNWWRSKLRNPSEAGKNN